jgi:sulfur carrier protein
MQIKVNNQEVEMPNNCTVNELIVAQKIPHKGVAIAVNNKVVPKINWENFIINPNDEILIITATQGG